MLESSSGEADAPAGGRNHSSEGETVKKMPCLFVREFDGNRIKGITPELAKGCEWVAAGEGVATVKWDGTACLVQEGALFKRYDAKRGKTPPPGFLPCEAAPDPVTQHWPGWVPVLPGDPASKWHFAAWEHAKDVLLDGTYELCGPHFQTNPYGYLAEHFVKHGADTVDAPRDFAGLRAFLAQFKNEGIVFHHPDGRMAKIRRDDFGFPWPLTGAA
jgi:hypothetical protein